MAALMSSMPFSGSGEYTTRAPIGNLWSRNPSPSWTRSGGVRSSTSSTNPGLGMSVQPWVERHFDRAELAGAEGVVERLAPTGERIGPADEGVQGLRRRELDRDVERSSRVASIQNL